VNRRSMHLFAIAILFAGFAATDHSPWAGVLKKDTVSELRTNDRYRGARQVKRGYRSKKTRSLITVTVRDLNTSVQTDFLDVYDYVCDVYRGQWQVQGQSSFPVSVCSNGTINDGYGHIGIRAPLYSPDYQGYDYLRDGNSVNW
jgi:hypothetical protein